MAPNEPKMAGSHCLHSLPAPELLCSYIHALYTTCLAPQTAATVLFTLTGLACCHIAVAASRSVITPCASTLCQAVYASACGCLVTQELTSQLCSFCMVQRSQSTTGYWIFEAAIYTDLLELHKIRLSTECSTLDAVVLVYGSHCLASIRLCKHA